MNLKIKTPISGDNIIKSIINTGNEAYYVGGCVRDSILGNKPKDWDIATNLNPDEVIKALKKGIALFQVQIFNDDSRFGVIRVKFINTKEEYEIVTFRGDGDYLDNRRPDSVTFSDMETDSKRRDFTINSMYYNPVTKEIIDLNGGLNDIESNTLKCVGNALDRFEEDPLRILRAIRFAIKLNLDLSNEIQVSIGYLEHWYKKVSNERIIIEFEKTLGYITDKTSDNNLSILKYLLKGYFSDVFGYFEGTFDCIEGSNLTRLFSSVISTKNNFRNSLMVARMPKKEIRKILFYNKIIQSEYVLEENIYDIKKEMESLDIPINEISLDLLLIRKIIGNRISSFSIIQKVKTLNQIFNFNINLDANKYIENGLVGNEIKESMKSDANVLFKELHNG